MTSLFRVPLVAALLAIGAADARADDTAPESGERERAVDFDITAALKSALVMTRAPDAPMLYPERDAAASLWRFRVSPELKLGEDLTIEAAYEHRLRTAARDAAIGLAILPSEVNAPYRIRQLDWQIASGSAYVWHHEIDRLAVTER